jgi:signal peptidase complex subunit 2
LTITTYFKDHPKVPNTVTIKKPFTQWFDKAGHFVALPFQQIVASNVKVVGVADPGKVVDGTKKVVRVEEGDSKSMDQKWASLLAESSGVGLDDISGASPGATPGRKKRGKKA